MFFDWKFWKVQKNNTLWWVATKKTKTRWWFHPYFLFSSRTLGKVISNLTIAHMLTRWGWSLQPPTNEKVRYLFIDKIHTLKQHRDDVVTAATRRMMEWRKQPFRWKMMKGTRDTFLVWFWVVLCKSVWECWFCYVVVDHYERNMNNRWWKWWNTFFVASLWLRWRQSSSWRHIYGS